MARVCLQYLVLLSFWSLGACAVITAQEQVGSEVTGAGPSPVQRVVSLLEKMKAQLEKEAASESEMYDKMVCWCETNNKEKQKAVADADLKTSDLESEMNSRASRGGELSTNIAALKDQISNDKAALSTATSIREKEAEAFTAEEKEMMQIVTNLKNAIGVLSRHFGGNASAMLQVDTPALLASMNEVLRDASLKYDLMLADMSSHSKDTLVGTRHGAALLAVSSGVDGLGAQLRGALASSTSAKVPSSGSNVLPLGIAEHALDQGARQLRSSAFLQKEESFRGASHGQMEAPGYASYSSRSSEIFGILKQMKDEFEANLSQEQKNELKAKEDFKEMAASKTAQITTAQAKLDALEADHADNQKLLSDAKEDFEITRNQRTADVEFLSNLKLTCNDLDKQWEERSKTRAEETRAVSEALAILKEDDARDLMSKTVSFLQRSSISRADAATKQLRKQAAAVLRKVARNPDTMQTDDLLAAWRGRSDAHAGAVAIAGGPQARLSTLAVSVELDSFTEVKKVMDKMIADLQQEQKDEVDSKAYCVKEFDVNEKATYTKTEQKKDLEGTLESLAARISTLEEETANAKTLMAETSTQIKKASETREQENSVFQTVVSEQRATQDILKKALARLELFYKQSTTPEGQAMLVQQRHASKQTPPEKFNTYSTNSGSSPVMGLLEQIIEDSKTLESDAVASEQSAQAAYEKMVTSSNKIIADLEASITLKSKAVAAAKLESEQAQSDHSSTVGELESLAEYNGDLHLQCDFLLKNFPIRQRARLQEIEAIQDAKAILSGAA